MLAIGRCLMGAPRLVMFDEPSLGLAPRDRAGVLRIIRRLNEDGLTILLVEQNVDGSLSSPIAPTCSRTAASSSTVGQRALLSNDRVRQAYLGL